jgi:hypothetical protein
MAGIERRRGKYARSLKVSFTLRPRVTRGNNKYKVNGRLNGIQNSHGGTAKEKNHMTLPGMKPR